MDLNEILAQFSSAKKENVYMSLTPGVGLELIQLDASTRSVKNYANRPVAYNESLRQIASLQEFKNAVTELFQELNINPKCNVTLNLPTVLFGSKELALMLADDAINEALTSEVEQSYIFKRFDPMISWCDCPKITSGDVRKLFYSAIQKDLIDEISAVFTELGAKLVSVQTTTTSILKALAFSNLAEAQMQENTTWNLMLVSSNGYSICSMVGTSIVDYYEEPLAIKSFEGDEIYNAISSSLQITLMSYPANYLYIISQTDLVSAELLAKRVQVETSVSYLENNDFKKNDFIPVSLEVLEETARKISLEAIGIASCENLPVKFDFLGTSTGAETTIDDPNEPVPISFGSYEFQISPNMARNLAFIPVAILLLPAILCLLILPMSLNKKQEMLNNVNNKIKGLEAQVKNTEATNSALGNFNENTEIQKVLTENRSRLLSYSALGETVPQNVWLTYFVAKENGKINIKGESTDVEDIYLFFKNIKDSLINSQLRLQKLELKSASVDDAVQEVTFADYEFEITNMSDGDLNPSMSTEPTTEENETSNSPKSKLKNKPLLNKNKGLK